MTRRNFERGLQGAVSVGQRLLEARYSGGVGLGDTFAVLLERCLAARRHVCARKGVLREVSRNDIFAKTRFDCNAFAGSKGTHAVNPIRADLDAEQQEE